MKVAKAKPSVNEVIIQPITPKRVYLMQSDVPAASLEDALRIPQAILEHYAGKPTSPLYVAKALNFNPKGSQLKVLSGASIAFGLIEGGAQAANISITELGKRILRPKQEGIDLLAKREAVLNPRIFKEFLSNYNGNPFPRNDIALNVLEDLGVPRDKANEVLERILSSAQAVGFIEEIKGKMYVSLQNTLKLVVTNGKDDFYKADEETPDDGKHDSTNDNNFVKNKIELPIQVAPTINDERRKKVFITHGKNKELVDPIKKLLEFGELIPVVSVERQSVSKPVPEKVVDDMRACGAAIIHVDDDQIITDSGGNEHVLLNPNVLIEIGAAMAFYGRRFILLVKDGVKLPSNLQGLYEVRYSNDSMDANSTIMLLEAIRDIKNYSLPIE